MSNKLFGTTKGFDFDIDGSKNKPALTDVSVNIPSYINRKTKTSVIKSNLKGGFKWSLWDYPSVAELPDGTRYLFDGDHRRHMFKLSFPERDYMPARIVKVANKKEISELWSKINRRNKKTASPDEVFIHDFHADNAEAIKTAKTLKACNLSISMNTGEPGSTVGASRGKHTKKTVQVPVAAFNNIVCLTNKESVSFASNLIQDAYKADHGLNLNLFKGLAFLHKKSTFLSPDNDESRIGVSEKFHEWFINMADVIGPQKTFSSFLKNQSELPDMKLHPTTHPAYYAHCLLEGFSKSKFINTKTASAYFKNTRRALKNVVFGLNKEGEDV